MAKLLLVDDDKTLLLIMKTALKSAGYDVAAFSDGKRALEHLSQAPVDMIITDIMMPETDGLSVIDTAIAFNQDLSILAISGGGAGRSGEDLLDAALTCGADAILQKPFMPDELLRTVKALLR